MNPYYVDLYGAAAADAQSSDSEDAGAAFAGSHVHKGAEKKPVPAVQTTELALREALQRVKSDLEAVQQQHIAFVRSVGPNDAAVEVAAENLAAAYRLITQTVAHMSAHNGRCEAPAKGPGSAPSSGKLVESATPSGDGPVFTTAGGRQVDSSALRKANGEPYAESTLKQRARLLQRFEDFCKAKGLEVTTSNIEAFLGSLDVKESTVKTYRTSLKAVLTK